MAKTTVVSSLLAIVMLFGIVERSSIVTAGGFDWTALAEAETATAVNGTDFNTESSDGPQKKKGNTFVRAIGAPFRAIGRLFGVGKKNDQQAHRIREKDAAKFESAKLTRVQDARIDIDPSASATSAGGASIVDPHLQKGRELLAAGDVNNAIAELSIAASSDSKSGGPQNLLGVAYEIKGLRERALESFKAAVHADGDNAEFLNNYGYLLYKNNDFEAATKYLKRAAKISPSNTRIWNNLAMAQCQRGKFDDAYASFVRGLGEFGGHMNIATQLKNHGYAKEAIKHLEQARGLQPNSVEALTQLASLYEMTGRLTDAEVARRSLVALKTFADANK